MLFWWTEPTLEFRTKQLFSDDHWKATLPNLAMHDNYTGPLPETLHKSLHVINKRNGYLVGDKTKLKFELYDKDVDIRIIVLSFNRTESLLRTLQSMNKIDYMGLNVSLDVWFDKHEKINTVHKPTVHIAKKFKFKHGKFTVHIHENHVGLMGQWINVWRPAPDTQEMCLILEDDVEVSPYSLWWLLDAYTLYKHRKDIAGYSLSHPIISHQLAAPFHIPKHINEYLYRVICPWGFTPQVGSWRAFQNWFYEVEQQQDFDPIVSEIVVSRWYRGEKRSGKHRNLWTMWHIYFTHNSLPPQYTLYLNSKQETGLLAIHNRERGLHQKGNADAREDEKLMTQWLLKYSDLQQNPVKFGYDGQQENSYS